MQKRVALIGPKGCGKTVVGQLLAKRLGVLWVDSDIYIHKVLHFPKKSSYSPEELDKKKELELITVEHLFDTMSEFVYSSGEGLLLRQSSERLAKIGKLLEDLDHVILLLPREDCDYIDKFRDYSSHEVETIGLTPELVCNKIVGIIETL